MPPRPSHPLTPPRHTPNLTYTHPNISAYCHDCLPVDGGDRTRRRSQRVPLDFSAGGLGGGGGGIGSGSGGGGEVGGARWECQSDEGWLEFSPEIASKLEAAFSDRKELTFETRHKVR